MSSHSHLMQVESHETFVGACVIWMHTPRGGYGYSYPIKAKIVKLNLQGDRATIEVERIDGQIVKRNVLTSSLRWEKK